MGAGQCFAVTPSDQTGRKESHMQLDIDDEPSDSVVKQADDVLKQRNGLILGPLQIQNFSECQVPDLQIACTSAVSKAE